MREKRADPLDDLRMDAICIQFDTKIAVVYRIKLRRSQGREYPLAHAHQIRGFIYLLISIDNKSKVVFDTFNLA